jgi:hypothetical protein
MTLPNLPKALLLTIVQQIGELLLHGAGGDVEVATRAAMEILVSYGTETVTEFCLAARIISCSLQAGQALAQAADPELPLNRVLRLRSGAVSLSREAEKAQRQLEKLKENRLMGIMEEAAPVPEADSRAMVKTTALINDNRSIHGYAKAHGISFTEALKQRAREKNLAKRQHKQALRAASVPAPASV